MIPGLPLHTSTYRPDIDGLRAIAVTAVVIFHAFPSALKGGFVGVDVFFVISGYLISNLLLKDLDHGRFSLARFYANRIRRIFPALAVVLFACLAAGWFTLLPAEFEQLGKHALASAGFVQNFVLLSEHGYFDAASEAKPLMHLWSLSIEGQFYLVFPLVLWLAWQVRRQVVATLVVLAALSFGVNVVLVQSSAATAFFVPQARAWELLMGVLVACLGRSVWPVGARPIASGPLASALRNGLAVSGLALIAVAVLVLDKTATFPGWYALAPVVGASLLIAAGPQAWCNRRLLSNVWLVRIGLISYPLYLWHWPVLVLLRDWGGGTLSHAAALAAVALSTGLAIATYRWVERPVRLGRRDLARVLGPAAAVFMAGVTGAAILWNAGVASRYPSAAQYLLGFKYEAGLDGRVGECWLHDGLAADAYAPECFVRDEAQRARTVVFWGDSYAARLYAGIRQDLEPRIPLGQFTRNACPPVLGIRTDLCQRGNEYVLQTLTKNPPGTVVLFGAWHQYGTDWGPASAEGKGLLGVVRALRAAGVGHVVVVGPAPTWRMDLPKLVFEQWRKGHTQEVIPERLAAGWMQASFALDERMNAVLADEGVSYFSTLQAMCSMQGCVVSVPGAPRQLVSWDTGHFTIEGARFVGAAMRAAKVLPP